MKKLLSLLVALLALAGCTDQLAVQDIKVDESSKNQVSDDYHYYLEKARWGDADAYLKLADFYREGRHVKSDFIGMTAMLAMAEDYNFDFKVHDYLDALPEDDSYRMMFETMDEIGRKNHDKVKEVASILVANGKPEGYVINGAMQVEEGDTIGGLETIRHGAELGSSFGELILCMAPALMGNNQKPYIAEKLIDMADNFPFAYKFLADMYAGEVCDSVFAPELAEKYYLKADEHGFLGLKGARWLLHYYAQEGIQIEERERQRLFMLAGFHPDDTDDEYTEESPSISEVNYDENLDSLAQVYMESDNCDKAIIYVVETQTGKMIGQTSLKKDGVDYVPFTDTFDKENDYIHGIATYLAVQWDGHLMSNTMIDTGCGVYESASGKLVKDHNWRRGGYGEISLEYALTHRSEVGLTKAIEMAYGNDREAYEHQISFYLNNQPNNLMGMLTFYNAIANGGKMVKICGPEDDVTVIHDQICYPEYIEPVQRTMERCVSDGIYKKAGNEYTDVAACGRTIRFDETRYRMELCGYFPTKNPQYTIMVVMEKDGLPASTGGICGPLFSQIVVGLLRYL